MTGVGSTWTAGYRADGLRAWKQNGSTRTYFLYDGGTPIVELDASGNVIAQNVYGAMGLLSRHTSASHDYTFDLQRNVAQRVTTSGSVEASFSFDGYGVGHVAGTADCYGFGAQDGYYTDVETGLQAMAFRYYDAGAGRWLNRDPIGYAGGADLYAYCGNQPVDGSDPAGLARLIVVPEPGPGIHPFPHHVYIGFNGPPCKVGRRHSWAFGFWPGAHNGTGSKDGTKGSKGKGDWRSGPGEIKPNDPANGDPGRYPEAGNDDPRFENALCACINAALAGPAPVYRSDSIFSYVCADWAWDMWKCATQGAYGHNYSFMEPGPGWDTRTQQGNDYLWMKGFGE